MKKEDIAALADIVYPDSVKVPLPGRDGEDNFVMVGPVSLGVVSKIEDKFGSMQEMSAKFKSGALKSGDLFEVIYLLIENKDDFDSPATLADAVPVMVVERLVELVFHFMEVSFPKPSEETAGETSEVTEDSEEKK